MYVCRKWDILIKMLILDFLTKIKNLKKSKNRPKRPKTHIAARRSCCRRSDTRIRRYFETMSQMVLYFLIYRGGKKTSFAFY